MKRVNAIVKHPQYNRHIHKLVEVEIDRAYCRHNLQHFLDVARVAYIKSLESQMQIDKELIYAAALLHDIGRWKQYEDGSDHALVSAEFAAGILIDCGFSPQEIEEITGAILKHRRGKNLVTDLEKVIYEGDKESRLCLQCSMIHECDRGMGEREIKILY